MKNRLTNNISLKIMAVLFAVVLWLLVVNIDDPVTEQTFRDVSVSILHEEVITNKGSTYQIVNASSKVAVTVKAKRKVIDSIDKEDIVATADMQEMFASSNDAGQIAIEVSIKGQEKYEAVTSPRNVQIRIEDSASETFPVTANTTGEPRGGYALGDVTADPEKILISGPNSLVNRIERVVARTDISGLSEDTKLPAELILYDANDEPIDQMLLKNNLGKEGVFVNVEILNTKTVSLEVDSDGIDTAPGYSLGVVGYAPQSIQVAGKKEDLEELDKITIPGEALNIENLSEKKQVVVDITEYLPENIRLLDENAKSIVVTVTVEKAGTKLFSVPVGTIAVQNPPLGYKVSFGKVEDIELEIEGPAEELEKFSTEGKLSINLENCKEEGVYMVDLEVDLPKGCSLVKDISVEVELEKQ